MGMTEAKTNLFNLSPGLKPKKSPGNSQLKFDDILNSIERKSNLTEKSIELLKRRKMSPEQIENYSDLMGKIIEKREAGEDAKSILKSFNANEMKLLQKANCLADPIKLEGLSEEGAQNLLNQQDRSNMVDLNNDGIVEVGAARTMSFPPVNAPDSVKKAWEEATIDMDLKDKMMLEFQMHTQIYGFHIEGVPTKIPLSPEKQWSEEGIDILFKEARAALEFSMKMDGPTEYNLLKESFYDDFEGILKANIV